jgi:hypothetical protein
MIWLEPFLFYSSNPKEELCVMNALKTTDVFEIKQYDPFYTPLFHDQSK